MRRTTVEVAKPGQHQHEPPPPLETDENGAPRILKVGTILTTLDRMLEHRQTALAAQEDSPGVLGYYAKEEKALQASVAAITYHRAILEGLPEFVGALRELVKTTDQINPQELGALRAARKRAQMVLEEYGRLVE